MSATPSNPAPRDPELDALLGAYALDALDDDERARVDAYLETNPTARHEVDELLESASALALAPVDDVTAPAAVWDRISATIADAPPVVTPLARSRRRVYAGVLAVAAAIVILALAGVVVSQDRDSRAGDLNAAFDRAAGNKDARQATLTSAAGDAVARVVVLPDGSGYLRNEGMAPVAPGQTYQLWAINGDEMISAGVLGPDPGTVAFHMSGPLASVALSVENDRIGAIQPALPAYAGANFE